MLETCFAIWSFVNNCPAVPLPAFRFERMVLSCFTAAIEFVVHLGILQEKACCTLALLKTLRYLVYSVQRRLELIVQCIVIDKMADGSGFRVQGGCQKLHLLNRRFQAVVQAFHQLAAFRWFLFLPPFVRRSLLFFEGSPEPNRGHRSLAERAVEILVYSQISTWLQPERARGLLPLSI